MSAPQSAIAARTRASRREAIDLKASLPNQNIVAPWLVSIVAALLAAPVGRRPTTV